MSNIEGKIKSIKCVYPKGESSEDFNRRVCEAVINVMSKRFSPDYFDIVIDKLKKEFNEK